MPELDAQHRNQMARAVHEAATRCVHRDYSDPPCEVWADALAPLVAGWLDDARADALREAADLVESETAPDDPRWTASLLGYHGEGEWLRCCADQGGDDA